MIKTIKLSLVLVVLCINTVEAQINPANDADVISKPSHDNKHSARTCLGVNFTGGWGQNKFTYGRSVASLYGSFGVEVKERVTFNFALAFTSMGIRYRMGPKYTSLYGGLYTYYVVQAFVEVKATPLKRNISPLVYINYGAGFGVFSTSLQNGSLCKIGAGMRFKLSEHNNLELSYNYHYQELAFEGNGDRYNPDSENGTLYMAYSAVQLSFVKRF